MAGIKRYFLIFYLLFASFLQKAVDAKPIVEFSRFTENGKVGLKNEKGQVIIPAAYESLGWADGKFSIIDNVTGYQLAGQWGLINLSNRKITTNEYASLALQGNVIVASRKNKHLMNELFGTISSSGKEIIPFSYHGLSITGVRGIA